MMAMVQGTQASMQTLVQQLAEGQKQIAKGQKQMLEMLLQQRGRRGGMNNRSEPDNRKCYNCQQIGHISRNCPAKSNKVKTEENSKVQGT